MNKVQIENLSLELEMRRLMLGCHIPPAKVHSTICPGCPYRTPFCAWRMEFAKDNDDMRAGCKGTRAWVTQRN